MISPMRPGIKLRPLDEHPEDFPEGEWVLQYKLDDERAIMTPDGVLWNRFGRRYAREKAAGYAESVKELRHHLPGLTVDLALVGIRRPGPKYAVALDLPEASVLSFPQRANAIADRLTVALGSEGRAYSWIHFPGTRAAAAAMMRFARTTDWAEGIIGRRLGRPYQQGDSLDMFKSRWRK